MSSSRSCRSIWTLRSILTTGTLPLSINARNAPGERPRYSAASGTLSSRFPTLVAMLRSGGAVAQETIDDAREAAGAVDRIVANFVE